MTAIEAIKITREKLEEYKNSYERFVATNGMEGDNIFNIEKEIERLNMSDVELLKLIKEAGIVEIDDYDEFIKKES